VCRSRALFGSNPSEPEGVWSCYGGGGSLFDFFPFECRVLLDPYIFVFDTKRSFLDSTGVGVFQGYFSSKVFYSLQERGIWASQNHFPHTLTYHLEGGCSRYGTF
jgi:hypothetical protein